MSEEEVGGRILFSSVGRSLEEEDEIRLSSVGVDIGSSTSHLVFSRLVLERLDNRYEELDFIDIGALLPVSGAVPVVIKSLVFPSSTALGRAVSEAPR